MSSTKTTASTKSSAAHPKIEKKIIDEKIAKVREVVKNISTNDIVLALHNFDLDVARTIHAFCEGGSEIALGDWEKTGGAKKRNNKKKAKPAPPNNGHSNSNLTKGTFGASSVSSISSATYSNGFSSNFNSNNQHQPNLLNGVQIPTPLEQPPITTFSTAANNKQQSNAISPTSTINEHSVMNGSDNTPLNSNKTTSNVLGTNLDAHLGKTSIGSKNVFANPISVAPSDNQSHLEHNKSLFENEIIYAQENIQRCFKEFRDAIVLREKQVMAELVECRSAGLAYFIARTDTVEKMNDKSTSNQKYIAAELEKFNSAKTEDLETALTTRFLYDNSAFTSLISTIGQFGSVIPVKMIAPPLVSAKKEVANPPLGQQQVRRSNSPSSLVSSLDSGLGGQISPVNQEKAAVAKVDEGGIVLKSDCISAEMLAEIQRNILDSLKAKGIDPSVLADINSSTMTAPRRRQPPPSTNKAPSGGGEQQKAGGGGGQQQRGRANGNKGGGQGTGNNKKPGHQGNKTNAAK